MMGSKLISFKTAILEPSGYITAANVTEFQQELTKFISANDYSTFLVDMHRVEFMDSAGLMALVSAFRLSQTLNKRFSVCSLAPSVRIIFELTQLDRAFEIYETRQAYEITLGETIAA
ncbi:STAS domain-containing protein [Crocosphaera sp. XPORK-15E]|uniref:STAS domain-containing protein n=1 Tax=Crocosphaera sp. XPORK-15E TaxID=3110247 RepID=UPI002B2029BF|nr:STAS domain-containing protein [Crocosphaera sp. XPORK-15E]MEA5534511.1 STAS domain-containing protein [Crocosphaera sp. XPORK-15E]